MHGEDRDRLLELPSLTYLQSETQKQEEKDVGKKSTGVLAAENSSRGGFVCLAATRRIRRVESLPLNTNSTDEFVAERVSTSSEKRAPLRVAGLNG